MAEVEKQGNDALTTQINAKFREVGGLARSAVEAGIELGGMLVEKRKTLRHGEWGPWLEEHFEGARSHAYNFIKLYEERDKLLVGNVQRVGQISLRSALQALNASDPFEEVFAYVEGEMKRLAAMGVSEIPAEPKAEDFKYGEQSLDYRTQAIRYHNAKAEQAMQQVGGHVLKTLGAIRAMRDGGHDSDARGWLREALLGMSTNPGRLGGLGLYGIRYRWAVVGVREALLSAIPEDNPLAHSIAGRMEWCGYLSGTVTIDLTEEETTLARLLAPDTLKEVDEAWEEDKDYELAIRKMETFVCPGDVPPSREGGGFRSSLSEEQLCTPFAHLRDSGELYEALRADAE